MKIYRVLIDQDDGHREQVVTASDESQVEKMYSEADIDQITDCGPYVSFSAYNTVRDDILC